MLTTAAAAAAAYLRPPLRPPMPRNSFPVLFPSHLVFSSPTPAAARGLPAPLAARAESAAESAEVVFFDGGAHYGDLVSNLLLGITLLWLPLTVAAAFRAFFLRYRFTNRRVTVISGLAGGDRSDFPYSSVRDVKAVPRFIGEWGDIVIELKDGTKVDLRSVPRFREVAEYCRNMATAAAAGGGDRLRGF